MVEGTHASFTMRRLGIGIQGGRYAKEDDGNPAWEDCDFSDSDFDMMEARWRQDDIDNCDLIEEESNDESKTKDDLLEAGKGLGEKHSEVRCPDS